MADVWALTGRADELARVDAVLAADDPSDIVFVGEPGAGKTRLAEEALRRAGHAGFVCRSVLATRAAASVPLGVLGSLVAPAERDGGTDWIEAAARGLIDDAGGRPLAVLVDDAHLLDAASVALLRHVSRASDAVLLLTLPPRIGTWGPVDDLIDGAGPVVVEVGPLSEDDTAMLVAAALDGPVDAVSVRTLWRRCRGNVLYLREIVDAALATGAVRRDGGVWRIVGGLGPSPRLAELVHARHASLTDDDRTALEIVALGEPLEASVAGRIVAESVVDGLLGHQIVRFDEGDRRRILRLAHPIHGEVVRSALPPLRAMQLNRFLYEASAGPMRRSGDPLRRALWGLDGGTIDGDVPADRSLALEAARSAHDARDHVDAERLAAVAGTVHEAHQIRGEALAALGLHEEAVAVFSDATALAQTDRERAVAAMAAAVSLFWGLDRSADADAALARAEAVVSEDRWLDEFVAQRATFELLSGRPERSLGLAESVLDSPWPRPAAVAAIAAGPALAIMGRGAAAIDLAERAFVAHVGIEDGDALSHAAVNVVTRALALTELGRVDEAILTTQTGYDVATEVGALEGRAWFGLLLGRALWLREPTAAGGWFQTAERHYAQLGQSGPRRWCLSGAALAAATVGDVDTADRLLRAGDEVASSAVRMMVAEEMRANAWALAARGETGTARDVLTDAAATAADQGSLALEGAALHDLVRLGRADAVAHRLEGLAARSDGALATARASHAAALLADEADALACASDAFSGLGLTVLAAEAAAHTSGAWRRQGRAQRADQWADRAESLSHRAGGVCTPAMRQRGPAALLSERELDVAERAAAGLSNKEIAADLGRSVRTIENHLRRIYAKLGVVASRDVLARALGPDGGSPVHRAAAGDR